MRAGRCVIAAGACTGLLLAGCGGGGSPAGSSHASGLATGTGTSSPSAPATPPGATATTPGTAPATTPSTTPSSTLPSPSPTSSPRSGTSTSACGVPARFRGLDVARLPVTDKLIALTFDAGANADGVPAIRRVLREKGVRATFFLTGTFVKRFPVKSARIGHDYLVGNHGLTHVDLTTVSDRAVRRQVREAEQLILATTGQDPRRFFRFPYGARTAHTVELLNSLCYVPFRWTVDTLGWKGTSGGMTVTKVLNRVLAAASPGAIVLMHVGSNPVDGSTLDARALPAVIDRLRAQGYTFVRLSRVMSAAP
jgi:peptidoglycan/xylan/chitin deacetylase (PgdA/CDA1 family)